MLQEESRYMEPLQLAGRLIVENGGEIFRVEETITRMGRAFGLTGVESFAIPSGVFVSYRRSDGSNETAVLRVNKGATNLTRVNAVNEVSRQVEAGQLTWEQALLRLREIEQAPAAITPRMLVLAAVVCSGGFAVMFGGGWLEVVLAAVAAGLAQAIGMYLERHRLHGLVAVLAGSALSALIPMFFHALTGYGVVDVAVAGALMPLLPGLAMTNAVQDTLRGDIVSGVSHGINALLKAVMVAGGALLASSLLIAMAGGGV
ncbi:MAG: threonine/serine exporter family protein [Aristaeellaceae bacterium]